MCDADLMANTPDPQPLDLAKYRDLNDFAACVIECHSINCRRTRAIRELTAEVERLRSEIATYRFNYTPTPNAPFDCVGGEHSYRWEKTQYVCKSCGDTAALNDPRWD